MRKTPATLKVDRKSKHASDCFQALLKQTQKYASVIIEVAAFNTRLDSRKIILVAIFIYKPAH